MPLCAACDFDDWLGSCRICLDIFEDIYSPLPTSRHSTCPYTPHATGRFSPFLGHGVGAQPVDRDGRGTALALASRQPAMPLPYDDGWQQRFPEEADAPMEAAGPPAAADPVPGGDEAVAGLAE